MGASLRKDPFPDVATQLSEALGAARIAVPAEAPARLATFLQLLAKWNRTYNLTAIRDPQRMVTHHLFDALWILPACDALLQPVAAPRVLDVGSGAGLPGIPLAVARPGWRITMLEPVGKKAAFIRQVIAELGLANAEVFASRVEAFEPARRFDIVTSRAFADLGAFVARARPHVAQGGSMVAMTGQSDLVAIAALPDELGEVKELRLDVPGLEAARHLVVIDTAKGP